ncbi:hypothetical protein BH10ACT2_BH10ACT2_11910 [soil metagenome]
MHRRLAILCAVFTVVAVACSVVDDGKVERIQPQFGLDNTLPSSTLGSTTTTQLATTTTGLETTTTQVQIDLEPVRLYFVASGQLTPASRPLASPVTLNQVVAALQLGPPDDDSGAGLRTIVPNNVEIRVSTDGSGVARIILPEGFFDLVPVANDQRLVIAQLVLTITQRPGVGQVTFNQAVPLPGGQVRPAGQQLTFSDYQSLTDSSSGFNNEPTLPAATTP